MAKTHFVLLLPLWCAWPLDGPSRRSGYRGSLPAAPTFCGLGCNLALHREWVQQMATPATQHDPLARQSFENVNTLYHLGASLVLGPWGATGDGAEVLGILAWWHCSLVRG